MGKKAKISKSELNKKKISFVSAIMLVVGSSIGAGIFLKNGEVLNNVGGSVVLALISWILSIFGVICMGLSLAEIGSANTSSNLGIVSWVKTFCHKYLYKASKYFMAILYLPINFFIMPYYLVMTLQDALGWQTTWWVAMLIAFAITTWLFFMSGLSSRAANVANKAILSVKFIPLAFCAIVGIVLACTGNCHVTSSINPGAWAQGGENLYPGWLPSSWGRVEGMRNLGRLFPWLGIIGSIPAIIFSFDGFYAAAGIQSEMAEPKKTPLCLVIGLVIVSTLDILISISLLVGSKDGRVSGINFFTGTGAKAHIVISLMELFIAIGILGIINGFAIYNPLYYEDLIKERELPFSDKLMPLLNRQKQHWVGLIYSGVLTLFFFFVLTLVGAFAYCDVGGYNGTAMYQIMSGDFIRDAAGQQLTGYQLANTSGSLAGIYSMADLMANWTAIIAFLCIVFALVGCLKNRTTHKVKVNKVKGFVPCSIAATAVISVAIAFIVAQTFGNFCLQDWSKGMSENFEEKIGVIMTLVMLIFFVAVCCIPSSIEMHREKGVKTKTRIVRA